MDDKSKLPDDLVNIIHEFTQKYRMYQKAEILFPSDLDVLNKIIPEAGAYLTEAMDILAEIGYIEADYHDFLLVCDLMKFLKTLIEKRRKVIEKLKI